jgi:hypothetical protein
LYISEEIRSLLAQAEAADNTPLSRGSACAEDLAGLLEPAQDQNVIAPTERQIHAWFAAAEAQARKAWEQSLDSAYNPHCSYRTTYTIAWDDDGNLIPARCGVANRLDRILKKATA